MSSSWIVHVVPQRARVARVVAGRAGRLVALVALATAVATGAARAQAPLGFTIDTNQGYPGDTVNGQVDVDDVAASCVTDLAAFQARFQAVFDGPFAGGGNTGDLFGRFFPGGDFVFENHDQAAYSLTGITVFGIALNFGGAAETALPQTFALTFADIATQEPVGTLSQFDPVTGQGSVVVPNIAPGLWAVAAACVGPVLDVDLLEDGIRENGAFLQSLGAPADINSPEFEQFVKDYLGNPDATVFDFLNAIGPSLLQPIVAFDALGVQFFTIPECGNGVVELAEQCDDGNTADGDCCSATCQFEGAGSACTDDADVCTSDTCDGAGTCNHDLVCTDQPIDAIKLILKRAASGSEKAVFVSKDPDTVFPTPGGPDDPRTAGATLELLTQGEGTASFDMPAASWTANAAETVYKFVNKDAPGGPSLVKVSVLKQAKVLKVVARDTGLPLADPLVRVAARFRTGLARSCALFEPATVKKDDPNKFIAKGATAPAVSDCSDASLGFTGGSPSGAFLDATMD